MSMSDAAGAALWKRNCAILISVPAYEILQGDGGKDQFVVGFVCQLFIRVPSSLFVSHLISCCPM
jgi:hypothetical protein